MFAYDTEILLFIHDYEMTTLNTILKRFYNFNQQQITRISCFTHVYAVHIQGITIQNIFVTSLNKTDKEGTW